MRAATYTAFYAAIVDVWWDTMREFLQDLVQQYARDNGACPSCGHKNAIKGIKECLSCFEPLAGHLDSDAGDAPFTEHLGFDAGSD